MLLTQTLVLWPPFENLKFESFRVKFANSLEFDKEMISFVQMSYDRSHLVAKIKPFQMSTYQLCCAHTGFQLILEII